MTGFRESKRSTRTGRRDQRHCLAHLAGGVVEHLLPCGVQPVLVSHDALLSHKHHLPGSIVHAHSPLIPQCCLLCLLLGLGGGVGKDHQETELQRTPGCPWRSSLGKDKRRKKAHCNAGFTSQTALRISAEEAKILQRICSKGQLREEIYVEIEGYCQWRAKHIKSSTLQGCWSFALGRTKKNPHLLVGRWLIDG